MVYQIIYSSESSTPMQWDDLEDILEHARISNAKVGITGALVYADGVFLQVLEGDRVKVQALMMKIMADLRHETITVLRECEAPCALFESWHMAYVSATPAQVAAWAGLGTVDGNDEVLDSSGEDPNRAEHFAQTILALLNADGATQTKAT